MWGLGGLGGPSIDFEKSREEKRRERDQILRLRGLEDKTRLVHLSSYHRHHHHLWKDGEVWVAIREVALRYERSKRCLLTLLVTDSCKLIIVARSPSYYLDPKLQDRIQPCQEGNHHLNFEEENVISLNVYNLKGDRILYCNDTYLLGQGRHDDAYVVLDMIIRVCEI